MIRKNVTMSDIAREMGVSTVSVSKALAGKDGVSGQMRDAIISKAEEMGYQYSKNGKSGAEQCHNIGIIISERFTSTDAYYNRLYEKAMMMLAEEQQIGMLEIVKISAEKELEVPALISSNQIDGVIVLGQMSKKYLEMLHTYSLPILYMDFYDEDIRDDAVISDSVFGSGILTNYLIHKGHTKIAFVGSIHATSSIMDRYIGYYRAMLNANLTIEDGWVLEDRDEDGRKIPLVLPENMPTAFVCNSDATAFELVKKLQKEGYKIPDDISVVGFDNFIFAEMSSPKITTYGVDTDALVHHAIRIILEKFENSDYSVGRVLVAGTLIERNSVKTL